MFWFDSGEYEFVRKWDRLCQIVNVVSGVEAEKQSLKKKGILVLQWRMAEHILDRRLSSSCIRVNPPSLPSSFIVIVVLHRRRHRRPPPFSIVIYPTKLHYVSSLWQTDKKQKTGSNQL